MCDRPDSVCDRLEVVLTGQNGLVRARTVANRAGTALTGAVRTGHSISGSTGRSQGTVGRTHAVRRVERIREEVPPLSVVTQEGVSYYSQWHD